MDTQNKSIPAKAFAIVVFLFVGCYMLTAQIMSFEQITFYDLKHLVRQSNGFWPVLFQIIAFLAILFIAFLAILYARNKLSRRWEIGKFLSAKTIVCILIAAAVIPRLYLISSLSIIQTSDYHTYWINALSIANENKIAEHWQQYFGAIAANAPLICSIFALGLKIFGAHLNVLLLMNILFYTIAVLALYYIGSHFLGKMHAFTGVLLFALWPNNILGSLYLASEPMYICFLLLGLAVLLYGLNHRGKTLWLSAAVSGVILSVSQGLRPLTSVFMIALIILILGYYQLIRSKTPAKPNLSFLQRTGFLGLVFIVFLGTSQLIDMHTHRYLPVISKPSFGWTLYEGNNPYAYGQWSPQSSDALSEVSRAYELQDVQSVLLTMAIEQLKSYDLKGYLYLLAKKSTSLIGNSNYYYPDIAHYQTNDLILHGSYPGVLKTWSYFEYALYKILAFYLIYICFRSVYNLFKNKQAFYTLLLFTLPYAGICALHALVTSIPRYGYPTIPFLILACFCYHELALSKKQT